MAFSLRAGVIGAGVFGGYHAAKWAAFEGVALAGVFDPEAARAEALAAKCGGKAFSDMRAFLEAVDIVSVASPASHHAAGALTALRAGKPIYVEKPLATRLEDADSIAAEAARRNLVVGCGFQERAAFRAMGLLDASETPLRLEAVRLGVPSPRNHDVSAVLDLMIHDLDLALALSCASPLAVEADGGSLDDVEADVTFDDGFTARFHASRVAAAPSRTMRIVYPSGVVSVDFLSGAFENTTPFALNPAFAETPDGADRLRASLAAFLAAVKGEGRPLADVSDGVRALDLALAVEQAVGG